MPPGAPHLPHQLQELLQPQLELQAALDLAQPRTVLITPGQSHAAVVPLQGLHHAPRILKDVHVAELLAAGLLRKPSCSMAAGTADVVTQM
jgi:hypothetical protein